LRTVHRIHRFGILALVTLLIDISNDAGYVALENKVDPASLAVDGIPLEEQSKEQLMQVLEDNLSKGRLRQLERELAFDNRDWENVYDLVYAEVVRPQAAKSWPLIESLLHPDQVRAEAAEKYPKAELVFISWLKGDFILSPQSSNPLIAGARTAILGSLWIIAITILFALPIGIGAAVYLEEYASDSFLNRLIRTNINNLAGVPSIIYGMLGLAIRRALEPLTSGRCLLRRFDRQWAHNLSAGLTMGR
jgi:phosphate transport system permease protein